MDELRRQRLLAHPVVKVFRWTLPWIVLIGLLFYLNTLRVSLDVAQSRQKAAAEASATVEASASASATNTVVPAGTTAVTLVTVRLRDKPDTSGNVLNILAQGTQLVIIEKRGEWYRAQDPRGFIGWVSASPTVLTVTAGK
jgi:SH3-like domain-containing protein